MLFGKRSWGRPARLPKMMRMTWKVVRVDGPTAPEELGEKPLGVIISSDEMLEKTQTLLFCPLIPAEKDGVALAKLPWHVDVVIEKPGDPNFASRPSVLSTKIVLPTTLNEIDTDGLDRGQLRLDSRREVLKKLRTWLPLYPEAAA